MNQYYVILSQGEYSDYSPTYFVGNVEITDEELDEQGKIIGDKLYAYLEGLPERKRRNLYNKDKEYDELEKFDPTTLESVSSYSLETLWRKEMEEWLHLKGFEELPSEIPELNVYYDIPRH